jgi:hypothetical protein
LNSLTPIEASACFIEQLMAAIHRRLTGEAAFLFAR